MGQPLIGGIISVFADGEQIDIALGGEPECDDGQAMLEPVMAANGKTFYKSTPRSASIKCELIVSDLEQFRRVKAMRNGTVTCRLAQGTFVLRGAFYSSEGALKTAEGKAPAVFYGSSADWSS